MAKKQTRRTISFNRGVYDAIARAAAERGQSHAEFITDVLRTQGYDIPETTHLPAVARFLTVTNRRLAQRNRENG